MIDNILSKVCLNVKGKNINRFIKKLRTSKVDILNIKYKDRNEVDIIIKNKDYEKIKKIKGIYDITEIEIYGFLKIRKLICKSIHLIIIVIISSLLFLIVTNLVFSINIIHSNKDIRNLVKKELKKEGIKKFSFKKSYDSLNKIKENILEKYPNKIEWLEIEEKGTKYIIRIEERKISKKEKEKTPRNIVAKKPGIIKKVIAENGDIIKDMDDYVEKGDLIINGNLIFNDELKGKVRAKGKVYAEIWYLTKTIYPFIIDEKKETGKEKIVYSIKFLNKSYELSLNKFKNKNIKEKEIIKHKYIPFRLVKQKQREVSIISQVLTFDEALQKAKEASINEIKSKLKKPEYIIRNAYLKSRVNNSTIEVEMFFAVYEDITDYVEIGD